jgi:NADH-quinone oxidoreductase subunit G
VPEKNMGPLIKTHMTRCIHCTRCIRFCDDVAGVSEMGALNRGEKMEVTTYLQKSLSSELSANVIDLCPVGALTSRPYAFRARPWELTKTESIDVLDAVGSSIRIDTKAREVMRILPRNHDDVNEEWISDKTRYACDGLKIQRLDKPYVKLGGKLQEATWDEALAAAAEKLGSIDPALIGVMAGDQVDAETMFAAKSLFNSLKISNLECRQDGAKIDITNRASYLFNTTISGLEQVDALLIIGADLRKEAPIINARIRKAWLLGNLQVANIGAEIDFTYKVDQFGNDTAILAEILSGKHAFAKKFKEAKNPAIIVGSGVLKSIELQAQAQEIADKFSATYNIIHTAASRVAGLDIGFVPKEDFALVNMQVVYLLAADELDLATVKALKNKFVIYQGHHGDAGAHVADVILPAPAYTEKQGTYLNLEGRAQQTQAAILPLGDAKEDWKILRALSAVLEKTLPFDNFAELREAMYKKHPHFANIDEIKPAKLKKSQAKSQKAKGKSFEYPIQNFYMTCPISRNSKTMAACSAELEKSGKKVA